MINRGFRRNVGNFIATTRFCKTLPSDINEADAYYDWPYTLLSRITSQYQPIISIIPEVLGSLQEATYLLPIEVHWAIDKMWSHDQGFAVAHTIKTGTATGISDGSFKKNRGTAACIIEANKNNNSRIYAVYDTPGNRTDQSLYRSKLDGISMLLLIIQCVIRYHGITQGSIQLGLDGEKAIEQAFGTSSLYPKQRPFDMLVDIRKKITLLPIQVTFFWMEGHQLQRHRRQSYMRNIND